MKKYFFIIICSILSFQICLAQPNQVSLIMANTPSQVSFRGMSIVSNNIIWVSGNKGTIGKSTDGGFTWQWLTVKGFEKTDFRDIHAFDSLHAVIMGIDNPAYILTTKDGGVNWTISFTKKQDGIFLDAMHFNKQFGICIGDPINLDSSQKKYFYILRTYDKGEHWQEELLQNMPVNTTNGEAIFSASGTNIILMNKHSKYDYAFVTGGQKSNLFFVTKDGKKMVSYASFLQQGNTSAGIFSFDKNGNYFYCVGGDYKQPNNAANAFAIFNLKNFTWEQPATQPNGYRSCIRFIKKNNWVTCGTNGVDITHNNGNSWNIISTLSFNVCMVLPNKKYVVFAGDKGKIGILKL